MPWVYGTLFAAELRISVATVKAYLTRLFTELDARDRVQLVILASARRESWTVRSRSAVGMASGSQLPGQGTGKPFDRARIVQYGRKVVFTAGSP